MIRVSDKKTDFSKIPLFPGVYFFYNSRKKLLYIGKAVNLRGRIHSYFSGSQEHPAKRQMAKDIKKIKWQKTRSDIEALILESKLIKRHKPFYNVALRDDKNYFYVSFTKENFPRIFITHQPQKSQISNPCLAGRQAKSQKYGNWDLEIGNYRYMGPFTDGGALKSTLNYLRNIFPYCACPKYHLRKCVNAELGKCLDFCCNKNFSFPPLTDDRLQVVGIAKTTKITVGVKRGKKEYRNNIRNIISVLAGRKTALLKTLEKEMKFAAKRSYDFEKAAKLRDQISSLKRVFKHRAVLTDLNMPEFGVGVLKKVKNLLILDHVPLRIEVYDVSDLQGKYAVGFMAVFENGKPKKGEYRKFKIRSKQSPDDTAMIKEILKRRFTHKEWPSADLIIIDGGRGQLNAALEIAKNLKVEIPMVALAKKEEELYAQALKYPIRLKNAEPEILNFFQQIRDRAHAHALKYHKLVRRSGLIN